MPCTAMAHLAQVTREDHATAYGSITHCPAV